jgi:hypothetical protein
MTNSIIMPNTDGQQMWDRKKKELLDNINKAREKGSVDAEVLAIMEELVMNAKTRTSMVSYYEDFEERSDE